MGDAACALEARSLIRAPLSHSPKLFSHNLPRLCYRCDVATSHLTAPFPSGLLTQVFMRFQRHVGPHHENECETAVQDDSYTIPWLDVPAGHGLPQKVRNAQSVGEAVRAQPLATSALLVVERSGQQRHPRPVEMQPPCRLRAGTLNLCNLLTLPTLLTLLLLHMQLALGCAAGRHSGRHSVWGACVQVPAGACVGAVPQ